MQISKMVARKRCPWSPASGRNKTWIRRFPSCKECKSKIKIINQINVTLANVNHKLSEKNQEAELKKAIIVSLESDLKTLENQLSGLCLDLGKSHNDLMKALLENGISGPVVKFEEDSVRPIDKLERMMKMLVNFNLKELFLAAIQGSEEIPGGAAEHEHTPFSKFPEPGNFLGADAGASGGEKAQDSTLKVNVPAGKLDKRMEKNAETMSKDKQPLDESIIRNLATTAKISVNLGSFVSPSIPERKREEHGVDSLKAGFTCKCGTRFAAEKLLNRHVNHHNTDKMYQCGDCGLRFFLWTEWDEHTRTRHHVIGGVRDVFGCIKCKESFDNLKQALEHVKTFGHSRHQLSRNLEHVNDGAEVGGCKPRDQADKPKEGQGSKVLTSRKLRSKKATNIYPNEQRRNETKENLLESTEVRARDPGPAIFSNSSTEGVRVEELGSGEPVIRGVTPTCLI